MSNKQETFAISPRREQDFPEWYQQTIKAADMAESSVVRGCMVIKPWGYGVWELIQQQLDKLIKNLEVENAYFPLFIPLSFLESESKHVDGFAKECAVVTHHRLKGKDGKLVPDGELEEPLVVRPTSETIIGKSFADWIKSYRDLPLKINQWANVVRWEMRTRLFLRTTEFLWQEGHTAHANEADAWKMTEEALAMYVKFCEEYLAMPVITGRKCESERFAGAVDTLCVEAMMQDRKAVQAGTSHYLGQNFAKGSGIKFLNESGELEYCHTTSWGVSTRLIGSLIMMHGDDNGMRVPPRVAPYQVVIIPINNGSGNYEEVLKYAEKISATLKSCTVYGENIRAKVDTKDIRGGEKNWAWIKKGVPVRIEVGPRDLESAAMVILRRDQDIKAKEFVKFDEVANIVPKILEEIQNNYLEQAKKFLQANIITGISNFEELKKVFTPKNLNKPEPHGGFVVAGWCGETGTEEILEELKVTIRCIPFDQSGMPEKCILTTKPAKYKVILAKNY